MKEEINQMKETMSEIERKQDQIKVRRNCCRKNVASPLPHSVKHAILEHAFQLPCDAGLILCDQRRRQNSVVVYMTRIDRHDFYNSETCRRDEILSSSEKRGNKLNKTNNE